MLSLARLPVVALLMVGLLGSTAPLAAAQADKSADKPKPPTEFHMTIDHGQWNELVKAYVTPQGMVDYAAFKRLEKFLDSYLLMLSSVPLDALERDEKLALLINAYNAGTVKLIIENWPLKSIKDIPEEKRWKAERWNIGGKVYSLDQLENEVIRKQFNDPRVHFALNCASIGCPRLRDEAYTGDKLDKQLDEQVRFSLKDPRWLRFDESANVVHVTKIFEWFPEDFKAYGSREAFIAKYLPAVKKALDEKKPLKLEFLDWDWSINAKS